MAHSPAELEAYVRQRAPQIAHDILLVAAQAKTEADLVVAVEPVLQRFATHFDVKLRAEHERTLVDGRADAVYSRMVVEYEPPGTLRKDRGAAANQHAIAQVKQYLASLQAEEHHKAERLAGVVLDGSFFIFARYREGRWRDDEPQPVNEHSTQTFLRYLLCLAVEKPLTAERLVDDFGEGSEVARVVVPALHAALCASADPKVHTLFKQWQRQFREITGYESAGGQLDLGALAKAYAVLPVAPSLDAEQVFFALHTYYATFIKLLALQVVQYYLAPKVGAGLGALATRDGPALRAYLADLERGGLFAQFGIKGLFEGDFFGWYLDVWDERRADETSAVQAPGAADAPSAATGAWGLRPSTADVPTAIRRLIAGLADYSLVTLDVDPDQTRDLLKQLYQNLMPKKLRHALGEYYTPDWLAERVLNQLGYDGNPAARLLDPACGSGTFLVLAIKRARAYIEDDSHLLPPGAALEQILANIVGYDLNPLAVIAARTNYVLALGNLLQERRGDISIPVYLCDSILTPSQGRDLDTYAGYAFNTAVGRFTVPRSLVSAERIARFAELLEECAENQAAPAVFAKRLAGAYGVLDEEQLSLALALYARLAELQAQGINGIWARILKNAFAPLFQGRFDYVAGNPPWVNWESLPGEYRQETKPLWVHHGLFPHSGMDTILGKGKKDISMLMTYVAMEDYLKERGRLGFVITQSVFKTAGAGQGFRAFRLGSGTPIAAVAVDDMADLKPFEGAANRTAIVILERGRATRYPLRPYSLWYKREGGSAIPEDLTLEEVGQIATYRQFAAQPVEDGDLTSPWMTGRPRALQAVKRVLGASDYQAKAGVCTWLNGVYWLETIATRPDGLLVVSNLTEGAKREVENVQAALEPGLLYPLLRGRDVKRWQATPQASILMVQDPVKRTGYDEEWLAVTYPKTYAYLKHCNGSP